MARKPISPKTPLRGFWRTVNKLIGSAGKQVERDIKHSKKRSEAELRQAQRLIEQYDVKRAAEVFTGEPDDYVKLTPKQLARLGYSEKSERFIRKGARPSRKATISKRQRLQIGLRSRTGERLSLEEARERRRSGALE